MSIQVPLVEQGTPGGALERRRVQEEVRGRLFAGRGRPVRIGRFVVLRRLGSGGMGVVYAARDDELERDIAVKLLQPTHDDEGSRQRLLQEARAMAKLSHPNVVAVHEVGEHEGQVFVAMELVRGETLRAWAQAQPRSWRQVLAVMLQVARGLAAAHEAGIVHRDVKPENALVAETRGGLRVSLVDFLPHSVSDVVRADALEASSVQFEEELVVTKTGALIGTPAYMAPELWEGRAADERSDQFAFCVTLWEALYGERPQVGETGPHSRSKAAPITKDDRGPSQRGTKVPGWLRRVVERGLSVDPEQRWPSMEALLHALERGQTRARVRRGLGVTALLGLGVAMFVGVQELERRRAVAACERAGESIAEVWNEDAREKLREALIGTGVNHAEVTAQKVMPWLDEHARAWQSARTDACLDTDVHGTWDTDLHERAQWCLDDRRMALEALLEELSRGTPQSVEKAVQAAYALEHAESCRERDLLVRTPSPPPEAREDARAVRVLVSRAAALHRMGAYEAGLEVARDAMERAAALDSSSVTARARFWLGTSLEGTGAYAEAEEALEAAYFEAAHAGAVESATIAAERLAYLVGPRLGRHAEALRWSRLAEVGLASLPDIAGVREARHLGYLARVHQATSSYDQAKELYESSLAIYENAVEPDHLDLTWILTGLANVSWSMGEFAEARAMHERVLAISMKTLGPEHISVAVSLSNIANAEWALGSYDEARELYERALTLEERTLGPEHPDLVLTVNGLAGVHAAMGTYEEAKRLQERALALWEKAFGPEHPDVAMGLDNLALTHQAMGRYDEAIRLFERALAIHSKTLGPEHSEVAKSLNSIANIHMAMGAYDEAKKLYEQALGVREKTLEPEHPIVAESLSNLARVYRAMGTYDEAKQLSMRALAIHEKTPGADELGVGWSLVVLADVHQAMGTHAEAKGLYERALAIYEKKLGPEHDLAAYALVGLARVALGQGRVADAVAFAKRAVMIRENGDVPAENLAEARFVLARATWEAGGDRAQALSLARAARDGWRQVGAEPPEIDQVEAWLAKRRAR
jgi:eukaryotic-like serine/threonine-protein kinase